jgi:hypothetical protein
VPVVALVVDPVVALVVDPVVALVVDPVVALVVDPVVVVVGPVVALVVDPVVVVVGPTPPRPPSPPAPPAPPVPLSSPQASKNMPVRTGPNTLLMKASAAQSADGGEDPTQKVRVPVSPSRRLLSQRQENVSGLGPEMRTEGRGGEQRPSDKKGLSPCPPSSVLPRSSSPSASQR